MEIWKNIKDYEGLYQVSNYGRIKSLNYNRTGKERILKQTQNQYGYLTVKLSKNGDSKRYRVHRLVAETFIPNPKNLPEVNHRSGRKTDNGVCNLSWCTGSENQKHAWNNGLQKVTDKRIECGKKYIEINREHLKKIVLQYDLQGNLIKEWESISEAGRKTNINFRNISTCCLGKRKTAGGFIWKFKDTE